VIQIPKMFSMLLMNNSCIDSSGASLAHTK
jgi:hypothetical protein